MIAAFGAFVVLAGLLMEQYSEQKLPKNIDDFRRCKFIKLCGEWLVIGGVLAEFVVAIFSAIDERQTRQIANKAATADTRNLPIESIRGYARILVRPMGGREIQLQFARNLHQTLPSTEPLDSNDEMKKMNLFYCPLENTQTAGQKSARWHRAQ